MLLLLRIIINKENDMIKERNTKQKELVVKFMSSNKDKHLTAEEILENWEVEEIDDLVCPMCRRFKIENAVSSMEEEKIKSKTKKGNNTKTGVNSGQFIGGKFKKIDRFEKLNFIDKKFLNSLSIFEKKNKIKAIY